MRNLTVMFSMALVLCFAVSCQDEAAIAELEKARVQVEEAMGALEEAQAQAKEAVAELEAIKAQTEIEEQNTALLHKTFEDWNKKSSAFFMEATTPDYVNYFPSGNPNPRSREEGVEGVEALWKGFPDLRLSIEDIIAAGDKIAVRFLATGTHEGEYMGAPPTGKKIAFGGVFISRIEDGKFAEEWEEWDELGLMGQIGMELRPKEEK